MERLLRRGLITWKTNAVSAKHETRHRRTRRASMLQVEQAFNAVSKQKYKYYIINILRKWNTHTALYKRVSKFKSEGAAREWSTVVIVIVIFISWLLF